MNSNSKGGKAMKMKLELNWFTNNEELEEQLKEDGFDHVVEMVKEGCNQGQLVADDENEGMITGWWTLNIEEEE
jgi:ribosome biogenesis protein Nip4